MVVLKDYLKTNTMSKFKCNKCDNEWEVTGSTTTRVRGGVIRKFDENDNPIDICTCGNLVEELRVRKGLGGIVKAHHGTVGNFKKQ